MRATRTYLELKSAADFRSAFGEFPALSVPHVRAAELPELYRHLYRTVGRDYHWRDRWDWSDEEIRRHLARPEVALYIAADDENLVGWYELRWVPEDRSVEIAYFGLVPGATGRGLGKHLLSCAVRDAWAFGTLRGGAASRVWLHTCTLDHPHALGNYEKRGFVRYKTEEYEVDLSP